MRNVSLQLDLDQVHSSEFTCPESIHSLNAHKDDVNNILQQFDNILEPKVGCIPNFTCSLKLREKKAKPVFLKARDVPFALRDKVNTKLDTSEAQGIISKIDCVDWGLSLVVISRPDGSVRLYSFYVSTIKLQ